MAVLSIQSHVVAGHVGNSAAVFCLQRSGVEAWGLNTLQFSNHTGYEGFKGTVFSETHIRELVDGLAKYVGLSGCEAVLSGYIGRADIGDAVLYAADSVKKANPLAIYCCDPVMGDEGELYVSADIPDFMRQKAVPAAEIITPNHFELSLLSGMPVATEQEAIVAARSLMINGKTRYAVITGIENGDCMIALAVGKEEAFRVVTPKIVFGESVDGAGDITTALFLANWLQSKDVALALAKAISSIYGLILKTIEMKDTQVRLISAQDEIIRPSHMFAPQQV